MRESLDRAFIDTSHAKPDVPPEAIYDAWRLRILSLDEFRSLSASPTQLSEEQLAYFACYNLACPTSHNTVPQRFKLHPGQNSMEILLDRAFVLKASDPSGRQGAVSIGCGIVNTVLAAWCFGWEPLVEVLPISTNATRPEVPSEIRYTHIATIHFRPSSGQVANRAWLDAMLERKVLRAEYDERARIEPALVQQMSVLVSERYPGLKLHVITDSATLLFMGKFQELADTTVFNRDAFALELGAWLLANEDSSPVGMRGREFGLSDEASRRIHKGLLRELRLLPDEIAMFAKAGNLGMRSSSAVGVITVERDDVNHRVAAGQAYQDLALLLHLNGYSTAMHAGITEVDGPNMALRGRLRTSSRPTVVFRVGKPLREVNRDRYHSSRPALWELLLPAGVS